MWWRVMELEKEDIKLKTIKKMIGFASTAIRSPIGADTAKCRYKICLRCMVFDREHRRCRAVDTLTGEKYGCGCYTPFLVVSSKEPCWARARNAGIGWK